MNLEDIHPLRGPIDIPTFWEEWLPYILGAAGLILAIILIWQYLKRRQRKPKTIKHLPPYEEALAKLQAAKKLMLPNNEKALSIELSDILRVYLEEEYKTLSNAKTSEEFLLIVRNEIIFQGKTLESLTLFLERADLAKFAKAQFTPKDQEGLYQLAVSFINSAHNEKIAEAEALKKLEESGRK